MSQENCVGCAHPAPEYYARIRSSDGTEKKVLLCAACWPKLVEAARARAAEQGRELKVKFESMPEKN